ncbi:hypothetical protein Tco_1005904 [Tanacetum coccineum]|uniref:Uncharacterized protein n=1 Tax=Tanacetum coccineum TaxID=301880 RepID=A0ABQ5FGM8_9ASTR
MALSIADQIALDDALVAPADRLKIGKCNLRLSSDITSKEATLQVVYDVLKLTPFYKAFQVTADAPEIYMQEFWASAYVHNRSVRFKMNNKKHIIGLEQFRDILQICPKVGNKKFVDPPLETEIIIFLASLGHSGDIRKLSDVNVNKLHQPWRSFAAVITIVEYAYLLWKDYFKIETKSSKKGSAMYYPRFTKIVVNYVMEKDPSIPRRNKVNWHYARDDPMFTLSMLYQNEVTQLDGAICSGINQRGTSAIQNPTKEYYAMAQELFLLNKVSKKKYDDISWKSSDDDQDDEQDQEDDDARDDDKKAEDDDDEEMTESDNDVFIISEDDVTMTVKERSCSAKSGEDATDAKDQGNEAVKDSNTDLDGRDKVLTDVEDTHVTLTPVNPDGQQQSSSVSSGFPFGCHPSLALLHSILSSFNHNTTNYAPATLQAPYYKNLPIASLFGFDNRLKALEDNFSEFRQTNQYAEALSSIPSTVDQYLAHKMQEAVDVAVQLKYDKIREESSTANQQFLETIDDGMKKIIKEHVKKEVSKIIPKVEKFVNDRLESEVLVRSSKEANSSHAVAANLSELELKKILIDKMETNNSINRSDIQRQLYKDLVEAYEADKILLDTYGDTVTIKRPRDGADDDEEPSAGTDRGSKRRRSGKEPASTSAPSATTTKTAGTTTGVQDEQEEEEVQHLPDWFQQPTRLPSPDHAWNKTVPAVQETVQPWLSNLAQQDPRESFDELTDSTFDFSAFVLNRLNVQTLTPELLAGPTFELMKGTCKSLTELEYFCEEVYKATTEKLDWINPEGRQYPHDLRQPLPLIPNSQGRRVIPFNHFINNDLEYLRGGVSSRKYSTSVTKTQAADYGHIKWIEDLVPNSMWSQTIVKYDKFALWGISHWGKKRRQFYAFATLRESARDVYSKRRIIAVTKVEIVEWHDYKHLDWITVRRDDDALYKFKEGDLHRLRIQDIEDMLLLLVQGKVTNLSVEERIAFNVSLRMFTRRVVIQRRVEDLQLGVESYQKKLNLTKPDTYRSNLRRQDAYTPYSDPRGFIYENKDKKNRLMRIDELHKFSDGTLDDVRTVLNDRLKGIRMEYLPETFWSQRDKANARAMIQAIDKRLKTRRIMRSLEKFVVERPYGGG